ncbi:hypothetical protein ELQ88_24665 [Pseudomonas sp. MPC6]|nr:hypothetical protein ELQ88_24665 [Pseudomonas sp. MPC6]
MPAKRPAHPTSLLPVTPPPPVGAGLPAKVVNENAWFLIKRGAFEFFAGKPAPTGDCISQ